MSQILRRILEAGQMTTKMESMKKHNQKLEKQLRSLKKYLSELPTRDEYKTLQVNNLLFFLFGFLEIILE